MTQSCDKNESMTEEKKRQRHIFRIHTQRAGTEPVHSICGLF